MLIGELFGNSYYKVVKSISSLGKSMLIDFKEHYFVGTLEFVAFIRYHKIDFDCQSWLNNNMLISPNNPSINCSWIITRRYGSYITLDFKFIEVKHLLMLQWQ